MDSHLSQEKKRGISDFQSDCLMANSRITQIMFTVEQKAHLGLSPRKKNMAKMNSSNMNYARKIRSLKRVKKWK
jgi:hypothetical protein